jgi:hypothetical protein
VNASWNGTLDWWVEDAGVYNITLVLDPDDAIEETDETNNERRDRQSFGGNTSCLAIMAVLVMPVIFCMVIGGRRSMRQEEGHQGRDTNVRNC